MNYEKKYKEALERARIWQEHLNESGDKDYAEELSYIFPKLKESEDEKIRKALIRFHKSTIKVDGIKGEDIIAWLEKQGEQKAVDSSQICKMEMLMTLDEAIEHCKKKSCDDTACGKEHKQLAEWLTELKVYRGSVAQEAQKAVDKVEPKFKVKYAGGEYNVFEIKDIAGVTYYGIEDEPNHIDYVQAENCERVGSYSIKENGCSFPTKPIMFSEQKSADSYCQENCKGFQETGKCFADWDCMAKRKAKSIYEVKPKFKVGDWICNDMCNVHIASIENGMYYFDEGNGLSIMFVNEHYHLWTIEDAMDGDVLFHSDSASNGIFIFKEIIDKGFAKEVICYCDYDSEDHFCLGEDHTCCWTDAKILYPATKEQRDTLFAKMKEAGYTFDFEKKELKKVEQEQDSINPSEYINDIGGNGCYLKNTAQVSSWSKKDEKMFKYALNMIEWYSGKNEDKSRFVSDWLKSIKDRVGCEANCTTTKEWSEEDERNMQNISLNLV